MFGQPVFQVIADGFSRVDLGGGRSAQGFLERTQPIDKFLVFADLFGKMRIVDGLELLLFASKMNTGVIGKFLKHPVERGWGLPSLVATGDDVQSLVVSGRKVAISKVMASGRAKASFLRPEVLARTYCA